MAQRLIALSILLSMSYATLAQALNDPMRPPTAVPVEEKTVTSSRLQSVLISSSRRVAVIDGRAVRLGERVGDATLVAIAPAEVTLERAGERQTLKLHPGVEKKAVPEHAARKVNP
jgi:MSHA biogenesis protein MshK